MAKKKEYYILIFNTENNTKFLYSGLSEDDLQEIENIIDFLNVPYFSGEIIKDTRRGLKK